MLKGVLRRPEAQAFLAWILEFYLEIVLRTTRWEFDGFEHVMPHLGGRPTIVAFWHERLPLMPMLWKEAQRVGRGSLSTRVHVLVSQHRDGRLIGTVMRRFRVDVVHGSSSRGGAAVFRTMTSLLAAGDLIAITPDGPRGPRRQAAPGVAQLAAMSGVPVLPCAAQITRRKTLSTWDQMVLPLPFGRGVVVCCPTITVARKAAREAIPAINEALNRAAERADRLCGA